MTSAKRLWLGWSPEGVCQLRTYGFNLFQDIERFWADYLGYGKKDFSFHSFRRTTCTIAVENGASLEQLMNFCGWRNTNMLQKYHSSSISGLRKMATLLGGQDKETEIATN